MATREPTRILLFGNMYGPGNTQIQMYYPPKDCYAFLVECIGGGGGGGNAQGSTAGNSCAGPGGSAGAYAYGMYVTPFKRTAYQMQIGAAGKGRLESLGGSIGATASGFNVVGGSPWPWVTGQITAGGGYTGVGLMQSGTAPWATLTFGSPGGMSYKTPSPPGSEGADLWPESLDWDILTTSGGHGGGPGESGIRLNGDFAIGGAGGRSALFAGGAKQKVKWEGGDVFSSLLGDGEPATDWGCGGGGAITYGTPGSMGTYGLNAGLTTRNAVRHEYTDPPELRGQPYRNYLGQTFLEAYPDYRLDYMPDCPGGEGGPGLIRITEYFQFHDHFSRIWPVG